MNQAKSSQNHLMSGYPTCHELTEFANARRRAC